MKSFVVDKKPLTVACYLKSARFRFAVLLAFPFDDAAKVRSKAPKRLNIY